MARLKPRAIGVNLLPKPKFPQAQNRFQIKPPAAPTPAAGLDPSLDQVLGKYT